MISSVEFLAWRLEYDNPTVLGWTVVTFYGIGAIACARTAILMGRGRMNKGAIAPWWCIAGLLLLLGINKQLNLQTLMIDVGRHFAVEGGWYEHRRVAQAAFSVLFGLGAVGALAFFSLQVKDFVRENRLAFAGIMTLVFFVILRCVTINGSDRLFGIDVQDRNWGWVLEIGGSGLLAFSAVTAANRLVWQDPISG